MSNIQPPQHVIPEESSDSLEISTQLHRPVLLETVVKYLAPVSGERYLDLTAGYGGHAARIMDGIGTKGQTTLVDRDDNAIRELQFLAERGARVVQNDFASYAEIAAKEHEQFDMILVDLGVSSPQLDREERGFSIRANGPLDMRMDQSQPKTAADVVNHFSERRLVDIITTYGEEPLGSARRIAKAIIMARPLQTTHELASVILDTHRGPYQRVHPATRTFQAIRIFLNEELVQIERFLRVLPELLTPGGRVAIISFHSLEDRLIKQFFKEEAEAGYEARFTVLTKKPIRGDTEDVHNPRARSAKLRVAVKK